MNDVQDKTESSKPTTNTCNIIKILMSEKWYYPHRIQLISCSTRQLFEMVTLTVSSDGDLDEAIGPFNEEFRGFCSTP